MKPCTFTFCITCSIITFYCRVLIEQHHVRSGGLETDKGRGPGGHKKPLVSNTGNS